MSIEKQTFAKRTDGKNVVLYRLTNTNALAAELISYGATLIALRTPDRNGKFADITLGYDTLENYIKGSRYYGATIGRYANRIARGKFTLNGLQYSLPISHGPNHCHGGTNGFSKVVWDAEAIEENGSPAVRFTYLSKDGEQGYPGNLLVDVTYILTNNNELKISYEAETDKTTIVNLTHHSYFNLAGQTGNIAAIPTSQDPNCGAGKVPARRGKHRGKCAGL